MTIITAVDSAKKITTLANYRLRGLATQVKRRDSGADFNHCMLDSESAPDVLIVTEAEANRDALKQILQRIAYKFSEAPDFSTAAALLSQQAFTGVICDARLGGEATETFLSELRGEPRFHTLPIVVIVPDESDLEFDPLLAGADTVCEEEHIDKDLPRQLAILLDW